jgi:hypothetical protein
MEIIAIKFESSIVEDTPDIDGNNWVPNTSPLLTVSGARRHRRGPGVSGSMSVIGGIGVGLLWSQSS